MKIKFYTEKDNKLFLEFNESSFPERGKKNNKIIDFRYFNSFNTVDFIKNNVVAYGDSNEIIGQALYHPAKYYFQQQLIGMEWGFDLFVRADKRTESVGLHLLEYIKANKNENIFASGVGEKALKIEKFFGYHIIGHLKKYFLLTNPLYLLTGFLRRAYIKTEKFTQTISFGEYKITKVSLSDLWNKTSPYNTNLLEFDRSIDFLKWRFFSGHFNYSVYRIINIKKDSPIPIYFVVRTVKVKGITSLVLVDYRYNTQNPEEFKIILNAVKKISNLLYLPIIITGSSHRTTDSVLINKNYKLVGRDRPIICNNKDYKIFKDKIQNRNFIFSTLADSDGEYLM
jgi:hypothetical protein